MDKFLEFVDKKQRESKRHLGIVKKMFENNGIPVQDFRDEDEPYIYVKVPHGNLSFDGIRIYQVGNMIAYRVQRESTTHPYGKAYPLNIEEMFTDYMSDKVKEEEAGKKVIESVLHEVRRFFQKSAEAEKELKQGDFDMMGEPMSANGDPLDKNVLRSTGTDYSQKVFNSRGWN